MSPRDFLPADQQTSPIDNKRQSLPPTSNTQYASLPATKVSLAGIKTDEPHSQRSIMNEMPKSKEQSRSGGQPQQVQKQHQKPEQRPQTGQQPLNKTLVDVSSSRKNRSMPGIELYKIPLFDTEDKTLVGVNNESDPADEMRVNTSNDHSGFNERRFAIDNMQMSSVSTGLTVGSDKMSLSPTNSNDPSYATFLRHPRTNGDISASQRRPQLSPQSPNNQQFVYFQQSQTAKQHNQTSSQQNQTPKQQTQTSNQQNQTQKQQAQTSNQQNQTPKQQTQTSKQQNQTPKQQNQAPKSQHQIHIDVSAPTDDPRFRPQIVRVRSYSAGRQHVPISLHSTPHKPTNAVQPWSIPRVSTAPRHHSLNVPSVRHDDSGPRSPVAQGEFSSYNPSASPRALRSHARPEFEPVMRQLSVPNDSSFPNSASNPPKSILKHTGTHEQSDVFYISRPLLLPRAFSDNSQNSVPEFDFSSILTSNRDILSSKISTVQISTPVHELGTSINPRQQLQRPLSTGAAAIKHEASQNGRPMRKSVTFNNLVRLHHEDQVSTVRSLSADT